MLNNLLRETIKTEGQERGRAIMIMKQRDTQRQPRVSRDRKEAINHNGGHPAPKDIQIE